MFLTTAERAPYGRVGLTRLVPYSVFTASRETRSPGPSRARWTRTATLYGLLAAGVAVQAPFRRTETSSGPTGTPAARMPQTSPVFIKISSRRCTAIGSSSRARALQRRTRRMAGSDVAARAHRWGPCDRCRRSPLDAQERAADRAFVTAAWTYERMVMASLVFLSAAIVQRYPRLPLTGAITSGLLLTLGFSADCHILVERPG